jgi:hypothetical protein
MVRGFALIVAALVLVASIGCEGVGGGAPSQDDPDAYTKYVVEEAIARYDEQGQARTLRYFNTEESVDGQWYVFIIGEDNTIRAIHPNRQDLIGVDVRGLVDKNGFPYGPVIASASETGRWVTYTTKNPARSLREQTKNSWVVRHKGQIFGSGWYDDDAEAYPVLPLPEEEPDDAAAMEDAAPAQDEPDAYAKYVVEQAIARYERDGRQETLGYFNRPESVDGPWYVVIADELNNLVSHATRPERVGDNLLDPRDATDSTGYFYGQIIASASGQGRWVTATLPNPVNGLEQTKHLWAVKHDGLIFVAGWYETPEIAEVDVPEREDVDAYTKYVVEQAINRYGIEGRDATVDYYNTEASVDGEWYVFIADEDNIMVSHAPIPENVGLSLVEDLGIDSTGYAFGPVMAAAGENGRWVSYVYLNPATGQEETKHSWVVRRHGLLFGSGWYEVTPDAAAPVPSKSQPDIFTKHFVEQAIDFYVANGREATIEFYNSPASVDGEWYVFISDENDIMIAHPTVPSRRGGYLRDPSTRTDITGFFYGPVLADASELGRWVTYQFLNPAIGQVRTKHTWAIRYDGLLFGSGWYE